MKIKIRAACNKKTTSEKAIFSELSPKSSVKFRTHFVAKKSDQKVKPIKKE